MKKNRKINFLCILITIIVIVIISYIIPIRKVNEIVYEHDFEDGGKSGVCYYNMYGIKIKTVIK